MHKDKRKSRRRPLRYTAWLALAPGNLHGCMLSDISETGARIDIDESVSVPDRFILWLSKKGAALRTCRVVWRTSSQLGVRFESRAAGSYDEASPVPRASAATDGDLVWHSSEPKPAG